MVEKNGASIRRSRCVEAFLEKNALSKRQQAATTWVGFIQVPTPEQVTRPVMPRRPEVVL